MKVCDIINPFKAMVEHEMLEETRLSTEFSIGFELEGICDSEEEDLESRGRLPSYHSGYSAEGGSLNLLKRLNKMLGMGNGTFNSIGDGEVATITDDNEILWNKNIPGKWSLTSDNYIDVEINNGTEGDGNWHVGKVMNDGNITLYPMDLPNEVTELVKQLPKNLSVNKSKIESDSSVDPDSNTDSTGHAWSFEWGSPIIKFNPQNIDKIYKFLTGLKDIGVYTNNSCGFHTHISFKDMTRDDAKWILFCIANDEKLLDEVSYLRVPGEEPIKFFGHYAEPKWFNALKAHGNLKDWSFNSSTGEKYLIMRAHPGAGTLEWRGPRNFINKGENAQLIKSYLVKLWKLVLQIAKIVDEKEYNGYKREEVLKKMVLRGDYNTTSERLSTMNVDKVIEIIKDKPIVLVTLKPSKLKAVLDKKSTLLRMDFHDNTKVIWEKMIKQNKEILIDNAFERSNIDSLIDFIKGTSSSAEDFKFDSVTTELFIKVGSGYKDKLERFIKMYINNLTIDKPEIIEEIYKSGISTNLIIKILAKYPRLISLKIFTELANSKNRYVLASFPELPLKVQRILIRKSPYNIQYINNPDASIINELKKKYGDDLNDYILGDI